jgi:cation transport ATPase
VYRAVLAIAFSMLGIFWAKNPPAALVAISTAVLFLLTALFVWPLTRLTGLPERMRTGFTAAALGWILAGILLFIFREPEALAGITAFGLALGGIGVVVAGYGHKDLGRPAVDMLISGGLGIIGAVIMVLVILGVNSGLDPHGVFGTAAMIVVVIGVHQILAGLSYRRDAKKDSSRS